MACGLDYSVERMNVIEFFVVWCAIVTMCGKKKLILLTYNEIRLRKKTKAYSYTIYIVI